MTLRNLRPLLLLLATAVYAEKILAGNPTITPDPELVSQVRTAAEDTASFQDRFDAQVWLMTMSERLAPWVPDPPERLRLLKMIHAEATRASVSPQLVLAVIDVESRFDPYAVSHSGAVGLMQIMPFWLKLIGHPDDSLVHTQTNLRLGCTILHYYLQKSGGDIREALQRYNGATVGIDYSDRVLNALSRKWYWN